MLMPLLLKIDFLFKTGYCAKLFSLAFCTKTCLKTALDKAVEHCSLAFCCLENTKRL